MISLRFKFLVCFLLCGIFLSGDTPLRVETYRYDMRPVGRSGAKKKRTVHMEIRHTANGSVLYAETRFPRFAKQLETIRVFTDQTSLFISGTKTVTKKSGKVKLNSTIWKEGQTARTKYLSWYGWNLKTYKLPEDKPLAVDASLLLLLRSFPFDQQKEWNIYMVDFTQKSISVTARQLGVETVRVKAGTFECYRIQVTVNVFLLRPKITYWLSKEKPHFLVKHKGMISPLSKTYITRLEKKE